MNSRYIKYKFIDSSSKYYRQMTQLRNKLTYKGLNLDQTVIIEQDEPHPLHLVALGGEQVVGCGRLTFDNEGAHINELLIEESMKGRGIAQSMMARLLYKAEEQGVEKLYLTTTADDLELHKQLGFNVIEELSSSHFKMEKLLKVMVG